MMTNEQRRYAQAIEEGTLSAPWAEEEAYEEMMLERVWLVESRSDDTPWELDATQGDPDDSAFVDEVDALAFCGRLAGLDNHDATLVRVRHRYETEPTVVLSVSVVHHMQSLFRDLGLDS